MIKNEVLNELLKIDSKTLKSLNTNFSIDFEKDTELKTYKIQCPMSVNAMIKACNIGKNEIGIVMFDVRRSNYTRPLKLACIDGSTHKVEINCCSYFPFAIDTFCRKLNFEKIRKTNVTAYVIVINSKIETRDNCKTLETLKNDRFKVIKNKESCAPIIRNVYSGKNLPYSLINLNSYPRYNTIRLEDLDKSGYIIDTDSLRLRLSKFKENEKTKEFNKLDLNEVINSLENRFKTIYKSIAEKITNIDYKDVDGTSMLANTLDSYRWTRYSFDNRVENVTDERTNSNVEILLLTSVELDRLAVKLCNTATL